MTWEKKIEEESTLVEGFRGYYDYSSINMSNEIQQSIPSFQSMDFNSTITLTWKNLNVYVKAPRTLLSTLCNPCYTHPDEPRQILHEVSGQANPGQLLAIMGSSGAGKTTLLNVLNYRNCKQLRVNGEVRVNGLNVGKAIVKLAAYVQQDDLFIATLTVKEHLIFQALLRMDKNKTYSERISRVEEVMIELGLSKCQNTMIGRNNRMVGISGGEAKRLAFASEVLTNPSLMFCDEPTSGLDSFMAQNVVSVLKDMASSGRTIICTIHQPSSLVYELFDHLLLVADGRVAYQGKASQAYDFFERAGFSCPLNYNPADFFIRKLSIDPGKTKESKDRIAKICSLFQLENKKNEKNLLTNGMSIPGSFLRDKSKYKANWCTQFQAVMWRSWISLIREPLLTKVRIFQSIVVGLIIGTVFFQQDLDEKGVMNVNGLIFVMLAQITFQNVGSVIHVFCHEKEVFLRENANGMYRPDVYFLSKSIAEFPVLTFLTLVYSIIIYWMAGLKSHIPSFLVFMGTMILVSITSASFGYFISCSSSSVNVASSLALPSIVPLMLFSGYYLNADSIPSYLLWLKKISWFYYGNEILAVTQWSDVGNISCHSSFCVQNGQVLLDIMNYSKSNIPRDVCLLFVLIVVLRVLAVGVLTLKTFRKT